jgi:hypothetical protein
MGGAEARVHVGFNNHFFPSLGKGVESGISQVKNPIIGLEVA